MEKPDNVLVYVEVGDPEYNDGEVSEKMVEKAASVLQEMNPEDAGVFPWFVTPKALPLGATVDEVPVVPYTVEEDQLKEHFSQPNEEE